MAATPEQQPTPDPAIAEPKMEVTINTKPANPPAAEKKDNSHKLARQTTNDSSFWVPEVEEEPIWTRHPRRNLPVTPMLSSSTKLLEHLGYDGVVDLPLAGSGSIYLTTFPFTDSDVKKWSWLFARGMEDVWLTAGEKTTGDDDDDEDDDDWYTDRGRYHPRIARHRRRERSPYDHRAVDVSSVYLSRALDTTVLPENTAEKVKYLIVVQTRSKPCGVAKLVTVESREAAGITLFYEALTGNSIAFVGAVVGNVGKKARKFKKAESLDDAKVLSQGAVVGVIC